MKSNHLKRLARARTGSRGWVGTTMLVSILPAAALVFTLGVGLDNTLTAPESADSCAVEAGNIAGHAAMLLDLRKPFAAAYESLPATLLRDVTRELEANTELRVYALSDYAEAPRMLLGRLCKPYDQQDLAIASAKDDGMALRDCDNLPTQLPGSLRERAQTFCDARHRLEGRITALMTDRGSSYVAGSHIVEALEATSREFERTDNPRSLYVFSDMMQHSDWYSHSDIAWEQWDYDEFTKLRGKRASFAGPEVRPDENTRIKVFYVGRKDITEHPRPRMAHRVFWERYFGAAELDFDVQKPLLAYNAEPLMIVPSEAEQVAVERARADYERQELAGLRTKVEQTQAALLAERNRLERKRREWQGRERELQRRQADLLELEYNLAAERQRLSDRQLASSS